VSWLIEGELLEDITLDLFDDEGFAVITLVANRDLTNLGLWFTPSVNTDIAATFDIDEEEEGVLEFDDDGNIAFVAKGTEVTVVLELLNPAGDIFGGGTLHVRSIAGNSRSYPGILGVRFNSDPDDEEEGELPVAPAAVVDAASFAVAAALG